MKREMASGIEETLHGIWQRTFQRARVGIDDNFFELGGNPSIAIAVFGELEKLTGRGVSPLLIYQAPTIASLAGLLESSATPALPRVFKLKEGTGDQAVFLAHGLGGNIMEFFELLQFVRSPMPLYGLQARGTDGTEEACSSIEEMARFHLEAVKIVQPKGPYMLVGYSLGGLVMWEMARRLSKRGERVALLMMIDSYPALRHASGKQQLRVYARKTINHLKTIVRLPARSAGQYVLDETSRRTIQANKLSTQSRTRPPLAASFTPTMQKITESARLALEKYEPGRYDGAVTFIRAAICLNFPDDPDQVWGRRASHLEVETVLSDHDTLLTEHSESLARVISRHLSESASSIISRS